MKVVERGMNDLDEEERRRGIYLPRTITPSNKKNKETI